VAKSRGIGLVDCLDMAAGSGRTISGNAKGSAPGEGVAIAADFAVAPESGDR